MSKSFLVALNLIGLVCCTIAAVLNFMMGNTALVILMCGFAGLNAGLLFVNISED